MEPKNWTIGSKMVMLVSLLLAILLGVGIYSVSHSKDSVNSAKTITEDRLIPAVDIGKVINLMQTNMNQLALASMHDPRLEEHVLHDHHINKHLDEVHTNISEISKLWDGYMATYLTPEEKALAKEFQEKRDKFFQDGLLPTADLLTKNEYKEANMHRVKVVGPLFKDAMESATKLLELQKQVGRDEVDSQQKDTEHLVMILTFGGIVVFLGVILLSFYTIRSINASIGNAVSSIRDGAMQITSASGQVAASSSSLAQGASEQASSVEEVSATLEQSTAINSQNVDNARQADILAKNANSSARTGYEKGEQLSHSMHSITESASKISGIIKTIDQIAFQTNLLALNAAVEAARAGEHGLGFAVVADEVRNLAQRAASAAKETSDIIEEVVSQIKEGNQIALATHTSFQEIVEQSKKVSDLIGEIAIAGREQSDGMGQINQAMGQVDQVTQQVAANSEEAAAAAEELNAQATSMMETVSVLAKMVGMENTMMTSAPKKVPLHRMEVKHLTVKRKPHSEQQRAKSSGNADDVFPLNEDDLKQF
ncbi:HAMP domain-containing methyl-accepting chemotaxis protein [Sulfuricurvum sp.]|uniref:HAMP domain-containing methyl-accepting chemotaxis protein n=1 Tax=Sulfuricurvum sp. TaxID=2025608 RepID=UPI002E2F540E|nr:methyl-accepting chemotaxis protein [Sulfuricurvum sp.]HEX5330950.1 methyl-accepting chemotaxis protein [Sulfuricurvum sp.]